MNGERSILRLFRFGMGLCLLMGCSAVCGASNLVFLRGPGATMADEKQLQVASAFFGVDLKIISNGPDITGSVLKMARRKDTLAVILDSHELASISQKPLLQSLERSGGIHIPLLILGLTSDDPSRLLIRWSAGAVQGMGRLADNAHSEYVFGNVPNITDELSNITLPDPGDAPYFLRLNDGVRVQQLLAIRNGHATVPAFVEVNLGPQPIFLASAAGFQTLDDQTLRGLDIQDAFAAVAPAMLFVKYAAGDRGWHAPHHYANLTIDDPWLRESYGYLDYKSLLAEMQRHRFHTTIAFIPWNYDRSDPAVVSLFRAHLDQYSVCVHGDNHDHQEFTDFRIVPLRVQVADLGQALARMNEFQRLTGIPYDKVFIFPHNIGEAPIFAQLRIDNYLATFNSSNIPMGSSRPSDFGTYLRPITTSFGDFPSLMRYSADMGQPDQFIAINDFLDNPLLFYAHQDLFARGINAFDNVADAVNRIDPGTEWRSLGDIATHLYLLRSREDANYDVLAYSSRVRLENGSPATRLYYITKREPDASVIGSVVFNDHSVPFRVTTGLLTLTVCLEPGQAGDLLITYRNNLDLASVDIRHRSVRVYLLRMASDFRDIWLSHFIFGSAAIAYYYRHGYTPTQVVGCAAAIMVFCFGVAWIFRAFFRKRRAKTAFDKSL